MKVISEKIRVSTKGHTDVIDITKSVSELLTKHKLQTGNATVFVSGSTAGVTTVEYEPGLVRDLPEAFEKIAPAGKSYHHDATWGDNNGYAHVRASLLGPSLTIPFNNGDLLLGTWQQLVLIDFDDRPRDRVIVVQLIGD
jgi:secondary thiamine-phosphate synthase enzyme